MGDLVETITQSHWAVGLEYKVADGGVLIGRFGQIGAEFTTEPEVVLDQDFKIWQTELFLTVDF